MGALAVPMAMKWCRHHGAPAFGHVVMTRDWHPPGASRQQPRRPRAARPAAGERCLAGLRAGPRRGAACGPGHPRPGWCCARATCGRGQLFRVPGGRPRHRARAGPATCASMASPASSASGWPRHYCVAWSALDARTAGFEVVVVEDACRAIDLNGSLERAGGGDGRRRRRGPGHGRAGAGRPSRRPTLHTLNHSQETPRYRGARHERGGHRIHGAHRPGQELEGRIQHDPRRHPGRSRGAARHRARQDRGGRSRRRADGLCQPGGRHRRQHRAPDRPARRLPGDRARRHRQPLLLVRPADHRDGRAARDRR